MSNQIQKTGNNLAEKSKVPNSTRVLLNAITKGNSSALLEISRQYVSGGSLAFDKILSISMTARIPNLTHVYGFQAIHKIVAALLGQFCNSLNLIRPMNEDQVFECSEALVMTTEEDFLSIEDYVLFFKGAKEGKYGKILDRLDQQTVFAMLEEYRSQRHREYVRIKEEKHLQLKGTGPTERTTVNDDYEQGLHNIAGRLEDLKKSLKYEKEVNRANRL